MDAITVRPYKDSDLFQMIAIWNEVVEDGIAFPQEELLDEESGKTFFRRTDPVCRSGRRGGCKQCQRIAAGGRGCFPERYRMRSAEDRRTVYSPSQQCRTMRAHLQCELCCLFGMQGTAHRGKAGIRLYRAGKTLRIRHTAI